MAHVLLPANLPEILKDAGLKVKEISGWEDRGRPESTGGFDPDGILCHHTATPPSWSLKQVLDLLLIGRPTSDPPLPGPLCQLGLDRDGTVYIVAAGRANHAGASRASGPMPAGDGNDLYVGIEAFNDGLGEPWPKAQYDAYVLLCAVLAVKVLKCTSEHVRAHKETSITGKIDPTFDMVKFRANVKTKMRELTIPSNAVVMNFAHASLQFSDSDRKHTADIRKIFSHGFDVITGTEAGPGAGNTLSEINANARDRGYLVSHNPRYDTWVAALESNIVPGSWRTGAEHILDRSSKWTPPPSGVWRDKGLTWAQWEDRKVGIISAGSVHPLPWNRAKAENKKITDQMHAKVIGQWGVKHGAGKKLAFIGGDFNRDDKKHDVFFSRPFVTCWDELDKYPTTIEGQNRTIDLIASWNPDLRVKCIRARSLSDRQFFLNTDHRLVQVDYLINLPR